jgi:hypothetical protein
VPYFIKGFRYVEEYATHFFLSVERFGYLLSEKNYVVSGTSVFSETS